MTKITDLSDTMERGAAPSNDRRRFMRLLGGTAAMTGGLALLSACGDDSNNGATPSPSPTPSPSATGSVGTQDTDVLNFALQLEYLAANYFAYATTGAGISSSLQTGLTSPGPVLVGSGDGAARAVTFSSGSVVRQYALEMAADSLAHVTFLRTALGNLTQSQPALNLSGSASATSQGVTATGAFTAAAQAAKIITTSQTFDPYASEQNFLIGAYLITGIAVAALRGAARRLTNKGYLEAAAGLLGTYSYHAATVRAELWALGRTSGDIYTQITALSDALDALDGSTDVDQDIGTATTANLVPTDSNGGVLGRTPFQTLNVVYLNASNTSQGGFYPQGLNGAYRTTNS